MEKYHGFDPNQRSESDKRNTQKSDSGYSTGCSNNSQSQKSGSSKSTNHSNSGSSNSSSKYGGLPAKKELFPLPHTYKSFSSKKKKNKKDKVLETQDESECKNDEDERKEEEVEPRETRAKIKKVPEINLAVAHVPLPPGNVDKSDSAVGLGDGKIANAKLNDSKLNEEVAKCIKKMRNHGGGLFKPTLKSRKLNQTADTVRESLFNDKSKREHIGSANGQFSVAASMKDGKVIYATWTLAEVLGFPRDMWIGRSFIDFVRQKDRIAFVDHVTIAFENACETSKDPFFCCLRKYHGFGVKDKAVEYAPFKLSFSFEKIRGDVPDTFLVITAESVRTAYSHADEMKGAAKFTTRHLANTILSHVDVEVVSYLGYLPQEMVGRSIVDFHHPEDLILLKEIYDPGRGMHAKFQGKTFRSKPYRFRTQNGGFVLLETEWSSFVNPWSKKVQFTVGQHRLIKGPSNPDVFATPTENWITFEEDLKKSEIIREEITRILNGSISRNSESEKRQILKRCKELANFMESLEDKIMTKTEGGEPGEVQVEEDNFSELFSTSQKKSDSVIFGDVSPHNGYKESKSSSESPPSYGQLNYNENLQRFFDSKPRTLIESDENSLSFLEEKRRNSSEEANKSKCESPDHGSGTSSGSVYGLSSPFNCIIGRNITETGESKKQENYETASMLTESVLCRHNTDMEKIMIKRHRKSRVKRDKVKKIRLKTFIEKLQDHCHGVKRSGSLSWESNKVCKHRHGQPRVQKRCKKRSNATSKTVKRTEISIKANIEESRGSRGFRQLEQTNVSLWPPLTANTAFVQSVSSQASYGGRKIPVSELTPVYYIATVGNPAMKDHHGSTVDVGGREIATNKHTDPSRPLLMGVQLMNAFPVYPTLGFGTLPFLCSPLMMASQVPSHTHLTRPRESKIEHENASKSVRFQMRPDSQATGAKAEPGSVTRSMVLSECPKEDEKSIGSLDVEDSLCSSRSGQQAKEISEDAGAVNESSSQSSFLKTDDSLKSSEEAEPKFFKKIKGGMRGRPVRKEPPWLEKITLTPELIFKYQLSDRELLTVLESDLKILKVTDQPKLVDEQLHQLYNDLESEGLPAKLKFKEFTTSCGSNSSRNSSSGEEP